VYTDPEVQQFINANFIPVRIHIKEQPQEFKRFGAEWTPTIITRDAESGDERHRIEGFLPKDEFLAHLDLAAGQYAFGRKQWDDAERFFTEAAEKHPSTDAAAEAVYWAGVSRYKRTNEPKALGETWNALSDKYPQSIWAKKASVWNT
jgi:thioredoxin-related protein